MGSVVMLTEPAAPVMTPCPDGWVEIDGACAPWLEDAPACSPFEAAFPGQPCQRIGSICPDDGWPADLPSEDVIYVRAAAPSGGDGSREAPFATVGRAASAAFAGATIAIATGRYPEAVRVRGGVTVVGACVEGTVIVAPTFDAFAGALTIEGRGVAVRNLRIEGERSGIWVDDASVELRDLVLDGNVFNGLVSIFGAEVWGERVVVKNTRSQADGRFGYGALVTEGGRLALTGAVFDANHGLGIAVGKSGSSVELQNAVIRNTESHAGARFGEGISVDRQATITLSRVVIDHNRTCAVSVASEAVLTGEDVWLSHTRTRSGWCPRLRAFGP